MPTPVYVFAGVIDMRQNILAKNLDTAAGQPPNILKSDHDPFADKASLRSAQSEIEEVRAGMNADSYAARVVGNISDSTIIK